MQYMIYSYWLALIMFSKSVAFTPSLYCSANVLAMILACETGVSVMGHTFLYGWRFKALCSA